MKRASRFVCSRRDSRALPPVIGWVAARGSCCRRVGAVCDHVSLQIPHTLAIAYLYREDFAKAGIQFLR